MQQLERVLTLLSSWMNAVEGEYKPVNAASSRGRPLTLVIKNTVRADDLQAYVTGGEQDEPSESEMRDTSASESGMNIVGPRYLTVAVHSRMLLRELRALITAQLTQHTGPLTEALILSTVHGVLSGDDHSLNELALDNEQEISAAVLKNVSDRVMSTLVTPATHLHSVDNGTHVDAQAPLAHDDVARRQAPLRR